MAKYKFSPEATFSNVYFGTGCYVDKALEKHSLAEYFNTYLVKRVRSIRNPNVLDYVGISMNMLPVSIFLNPVDESEVLSAFLNLKKSTAPDSFGMQIRPSKAVMPYIMPILTFIFNSCLQKGTLPRNMQVAKVTVVHKGGDKTSTESQYISDKV